VSSTELDAVVPAGDETVDVIVANPDGQEDVLVDGFRIRPNLPPTLDVHSPAGDEACCRGGTVVISYTDDDAEDVATTDLFGDRDGDLSTTGDQVEIARGLPEADGTVHDATWTTAGVAPGAYRIVARTDDGKNPPVTATAPGLVTIENRAFARRVDTSGYSRAHGVATFPDGSVVVTGDFSGIATFGEGDATETELTADGNRDIFVARYDAVDKHAWEAHAGGCE
jgi:hypothetical protein